MSEKVISKFFEQYSRNLHIVRNGPIKVEMHPDVDDVFICPLCFDKFFTRDAINQKRLTLEHIPPKALGGRVRTLTCEPCNCNTGGSKLDSQIKKKLEFIEFWQNKSKSALEIRYSINDGAYLPGTLSMPAGGLKLLVGQLA